MPHAHTTPIEIVCHRGANEFAPENTYASSQICVDWGMDVIEIDVNTSNDGVLYLFHGPELEKTTNGTGYIMAHLAEDIDNLLAGFTFGNGYQNERIPRLEDYLRWVKGKAKLFLDVKFADLNHLIALIRKYHLEQDCFFWFGMPEMAQTFRKLAPDFLLKVNANTIAEIHQAVEQFNANIIETDYEAMSTELRDTCHSLGLKFMVYYKGAEEEDFRRIIELRPDMVNTNYGDRLQRVIRQYIQP